MTTECGSGKLLGVFSNPSLLLLPLVLLLSACATLNKQECLSGQWQALGYQDGTKGRQPQVFVKLHDKACARHGVVVDKALYQRGHHLGLADFCQAPTGYRLGRNEDAYQYVCPVELEPDFLLAYSSGLRDTLQEIRSYEYYLEDRLLDARWRHRSYQRQIDLNDTSEQTESYVAKAHRIADVIENRIDDVRDRRIRIRNALARASNRLQQLKSVQNPSDSNQSS